MGFSWNSVGGGLNIDAVSTAAPSPRGCSPSTSPPNSPRRSEKDVLLFYTIEAMSTRGSRENLDGEALRGERALGSRRDSLSEQVQRRDHVARKTRTSSQARWR